MDRTNLKMYPFKKVLGILINEGSTNPPLKEKTTPSKRGKGKAKKSISEVPKHNYGNEGEFITPRSHFLSWKTTNLYSPKGKKFMLGLAETGLEFKRPPLWQLIQC